MIHLILLSGGSGMRFHRWKFCSTASNADNLLKNFQRWNETDGSMFKIKAGPHFISNLGNLIRKHSIDRLPQFLNVFMGNLFVADRNNSTWESGERQGRELFYVRHQSFGLDARIFVKTFKAMARGK